MRKSNIFSPHIISRNKKKPSPSIYIESHAIYLVFPFKHRLVQGWKTLETETITDFTNFSVDHDKFSFVAPAARSAASDIDPAKDVLGNALLEKLTTHNKRMKNDTTNDRVWIKKSISISEDLHPYLHGMLGTQQPTREKLYNDCRPYSSEYFCFALSATLLEIINARLPNHQNIETIETSKHSANTCLKSGCGLVMQISSNYSQHRTEQNFDKKFANSTEYDGTDSSAEAENKIHLLGVKIKSATTYLSRTRYGQLVLEIQLLPADISNHDAKYTKKTLPVETIIELLHKIGRAPAWSDQNIKLMRIDSNGTIPLNEKSKPNPQVSFPIRTLAMALVAPILDEAPRWERLFTYVSTVIEGAVANDSVAIQGLAKRLARRQTGNYAVGDKILGVELVQPFDTVCHAVSVEGGAVVVSPRGIGFLKNFVTNSSKYIYLPLALVANREYGTLLRISQETAIPIEHDAVDLNTIHHMEKMRDYLYNFRLAHRFSSVSNISLHNAVFQAWRRSLQTEQMLKDLNEDVLSAVTYLESTKRKQFETRFGWTALIVATCLAFVATNNATESVIKATKRLLMSSSHSYLYIQNQNLLDNVAAISPPMAGLAVAAAIFYFGMLRRKIGIVV